MLEMITLSLHVESAPDYGGDEVTGDVDPNADMTKPADGVALRLRSPTSSA